MVSKTLALLALSSLTLAKPHGHGHQHQHVARHGREGGRMRPTGGFFPGGNGTWGDAPFPTGSGAGSLPVITQTVVPVPGGGDPQPTGGAAPPVGGGQDKPSPPADQVPSGGEGGAPPADQVPSGGQGDEPSSGDQGEFWGDKDGFQPPPDVNNNIPATPPSNPVSGGQGGGTGGSGNAGGAGGAGNGAPGSNPVSGGQGGGAGNGGGAGGAGNAGGAGGECVPRTETATKVEYVTVTAGSEGASPSNAAGAGGPPAADDQTNLDGAKDPAAGQFFGVPTGGFGGNGQGYGGQHGGQGQGGNQGGAQPVPTTFATMPSGGYGAPSATGGTPAVPTGGNGSGSGNGTTPPSGGSGGGKRGLSYNDAGPLSAFAGTGMTWAYNWADSEGGSLPDGIEYVPMCWGSDSIATCGQKAAGAKHVLSFNEPDLGEQADMTPEAAAQGHIKALNPLAAQGTLIGSPSITNGGAPMGTAWLQNWFDACAGQCKVDFVTFHWYDSANNFAYFQKHVEDVVALAQKNGVSKVWLTEFGVTSGDAATFIGQANEYLDSNPAVERYAYFWAAQGALLQGNGLSAAGKAYVA